MGKNQGFLSVNLSEARDNSTWAVSWSAELTATHVHCLCLCVVSVVVSVVVVVVCVARSKRPPCVHSKRPRVYRNHARMW